LAARTVVASHFLPYCASPPACRTIALLYIFRPIFGDVYVRIYGSRHLFSWWTHARVRASLLFRRRIFCYMTACFFCASASSCAYYSISVRGFMTQYHFITYVFYLVYCLPTLHTFTCVLPAFDHCLPPLGLCSPCPSGACGYGYSLFYAEKAAGRTVLFLHALYHRVPHLRVKLLWQNVVNASRVSVRSAMTPRELGGINLLWTCPFRHVLARGTGAGRAKRLKKEEAEEEHVSAIARLCLCMVLRRCWL